MRLKDGTAKESRTKDNRAENYSENYLHNKVDCFIIQKPLYHADYQAITGLTSH